MTPIETMVSYLMTAKPWRPDRCTNSRVKRCVECDKVKQLRAFAFGGSICKECKRAPS